MRHTCGCGCTVDTAAALVVVDVVAIFFNGFFSYGNHRQHRAHATFADADLCTRVTSARVRSFADWW
eukprot:1268394-Pyramimonas_sp.AAC.1